MTASFLFDLLTRAARGFGTHVEDGAPEWVGPRFNAETLAEVPKPIIGDRARRDLPEASRSYRFDGAPVIVGVLFPLPQAEDSREVLRRHRNQALVARSWLGIEAVSLQMFLIGPLRSFESEEWRRRALEIEMDDRVCRKLVWLPSASPNVEEATRFLCRTTFSRPWQAIDSPPGGQPRLDSISERLLPPEWLNVIQNDDLTPDDMIAGLLLAEQEKTS
jgi:hypothetical protein